MNIPGAVVYRPGEEVLVFLQRMPNGYLRTTGWAQGRFGIDSRGTLHADSALGGAEVIDLKTPSAAATSLRTLEGMSLNEVTSRIAARISSVKAADAARTK